VAEFHDKAIEITATRSTGADGAFVVFIDTPNWEPDGSDGGPGLRVVLNDGEIYDVVPWEPFDDSIEDFVERDAASRLMTIRLSEIDYTPEEG
jgi:hypothetical protein